MNMYLDLEIYPNYFLAMFMNDNEKFGYVEMYNDSPLDDEKFIRLLSAKATYYTFNGANFDMPLVRYALAGASNAQLKEACDKIILSNTKHWQFAKMYPQVSLDIDHVDLIEVAPGMNSLKTYGGRMHCKRLQELPVDPSTHLNDEQVNVIRNIYCPNDLRTTKSLRGTLAKQIELRVALREALVAELGVVKGAHHVFEVEDLRSKSDAQIAESVLKQRVFVATGAIPRKLNGPVSSFKCTTPPYLKFKSTELNSLLDDVRNAVFNIKDSGHVQMPSNLEDRVVEVAGKKYKVGIGGLHSQEESVTRRARPGEILRDIDVVSYYPSLMLNLGLYPDATGPHFLKAYRDIKDERVAAKNKMTEIDNEIQELEKELAGLQ